MINVQDHMNEIRYLLSQCTDQANAVDKQLKNLDMETIQLNVVDLTSKLAIAQLELKDLGDALHAYLISST